MTERPYIDLGVGELWIAPAGGPSPRWPRPRRVTASARPAGYDAVLSTIDQALDDWEVSPDAMRWRPDPSAHDDPRPGQQPDLVITFDIDTTALQAAFDRAVDRAILYGDRLSTTAPYRQGHGEFARSAAAIARAFDVPLWLVDPTAVTLARRRRAVRVAYRRRQLARRRRR
jgi:hypothetical protein